MVPSSDSAPRFGTGGDSARPRQRCGRIIVLPNRTTFGAVAVILAMLYAGISQGNAAAYLLAFLLLSVTAVSALHAWNNLRRLTVRFGGISPVHEGDAPAVPLELHSARGGTHPAVRVRLLPTGEETASVTVTNSATATALASLPHLPRGLYQQFRWEVITRFPLGLFTARRRGEDFQAYYVYPRPEGRMPPPGSTDARRPESTGLMTEGEDFYGVRAWRLGESMRHIDWKAVARGQAVMTKQWSGGASSRLAFTWEQVAHLEPEAALRQLALWVRQAHQQDAVFALSLPTKQIPSGKGEHHVHEALRALAEMPRQLSA